MPHIQKVRPNIIFCCVCQEAIKQAKAAIIQKMTQVTFSCLTTINYFLMALMTVYYNIKQDHHDIYTVIMMSQNNDSQQYKPYFTIIEKKLNLNLM